MVRREKREKLMDAGGGSKQRFVCDLRSDDLSSRTKLRRSTAPYSGISLKVYLCFEMVINYSVYALKRTRELPWMDRHPSENLKLHCIWINYRLDSGFRQTRSKGKLRREYSYLEVTSLNYEVLN